MTSNTSNESGLGMVLSPEESNERLMALHRQLYASSDVSFDDVMFCFYKAPPGYVAVDPQLVHDGSQWHLFYVTGKIEYADEWINAIRVGDFKRAREIPYEEGDGHAVGGDLFELKYHSTILTDVQGEYGLGLQGDSGLVWHDDHWVNLFSARGPDGTSLCLAYSNDLYEWELDKRNPILWPPEWARRPGKYGSAFIVPWEDMFLIYTDCIGLDGLGAVQLLTTVDFEHFEERGPVFKMPLQLRGTMCVESPCVVQRDGLWHLFVTSGTGTWHAVSDRADRFMGVPATTEFTASLGAYYMGPFHACRVLQGPDGQWYMIGTSKEERRRCNRQDGISKYRGSAEDEAALLEGLFICTVRWQGDQPILQRPMVRCKEWCRTH